VLEQRLVLTLHDLEPADPAADVDATRSAFSGVICNSEFFRAHSTAGMAN